MPLITPPFRTSLLTQNGAPYAGDNSDIQTAKDWWLYWNQLTDRSNANSKLATAGTHGDRPRPESMPEGALYYENDRGVLYASTLGVWQYVAGTMWATLSPDQRPTDLGTHDAGFDFRTTVAPPREFIWSQTAWVETTSISGAVNLTHPNIVPKIGSPGELIEGGISDASPANSGSLQISPSGNVLVANALQINGQIVTTFVVGAANDAAAATAGVPLFGVYHNAGALRFRIT